MTTKFNAVQLRFRFHNQCAINFTLTLANHVQMCKTYIGPCKHCTANANIDKLFGILLTTTSIITVFTWYYFQHNCQLPKLLAGLLDSSLQPAEEAWVNVLCHSRQVLAVEGRRWSGAHSRLRHTDPGRPRWSAASNAIATGTGTASTASSAAAAAVAQVVRGSLWGPTGSTVNAWRWPSPSPASARAAAARWFLIALPPNHEAQRKPHLQRA